MSKYIEMEGMKFGALIANRFLGGDYGEWECTCTLCNSTYITRGKYLRNGYKIMCEDCKKAGKIIKNYTKPDLNANKIKYDMSGLRVGSIVVNRYIKDGSWECTCDCSNNIIVKGYNLREALKNNKDYCCEECSVKRRLNNISGKTFGRWLVLEYAGDGMYKCQCQCKNKTIKLVNGKSLKNGTSLSCGCISRELSINTRYERYGDITSNIKSERDIEQIEACADKEKLIEFILNNFENKPSIIELASKIGISTCMTARKIHKFNVEEYIDYSTNKSNDEKELSEYIRNAYNGEILTSDRSLLEGKELDIYIPNEKLAFEFNGSYWHSTIYKDKKYHYEKVKNCEEKGVRLIHIYDYEWNDKLTREKIIRYINNIFNKNKINIYARDTEIKTVNNTEAMEFLNKYHLQKYTTSTINLGLYKDEQLIGIMTFGKPRFNTEYEYELIRLCWKDGVCVIGGAEKLFKNAIEKYNIKSLITYCNIDKFTGNVYERLGMKLQYIAEPNYVWVNGRTLETLSRYQTQKHKLVADGLGTDDQTEDDIMETLGYFKVYDSGNKVYTWKADELNL